MSFKGEVLGVPIHISEAVAHFEDISLSYQWIDLLKSITDLGSKKDGSDVHLVYQRLSLPWPVSDRELILEVRERQIIQIYLLLV